MPPLTPYQITYLRPHSGELKNDYRQQSGILLSGRGPKTQPKHNPFPPPEAEKRNPDISGKGKPNDIAQGLIIQVFKV